MDRKTILVADDETHILNVLSLKLSNAGYRVLPAEDGAEALNLALSEHPDVIITDYQMPRMSGLELCSRLRSHPSTSDIPAILLTARGFSISPQEMAQVNIRSVMSKPFSPREVLSRVQVVLATAPVAGAAVC
ncbi:MAG: hypothetical protein AMXMBFR13_50000 [Phycisphaerae bacterium]|jgi:two-component system alkaline phosphatase synthesis response regulator PhoP